jgi:hypothetical protein
MIGVGSVLAFLFIVGIMNPSAGSSNNNTDKAAEPKPTWNPISYSEFSTAVGLTPLTKSQCKPFVSLVASPKLVATAKKRSKAIDKADGNAWSAYSYVAKNDWTSTPSALLDNWKASWDSALSDYFDTLAAKAASNTEIIKSKEALLPDFTSQVTTDCKLASTLTKNEGLFSTVSTKATAVVSLADTKPWYPKGYSEWEDGLAWKWVNAYDDCYSCSYWHIKVISRDGCAGGIYAEMNIERGGSVVDWTNDSIPYLGAGSKALLTFETYSNGNLTGDMTTLTCHS